MKKILFFCLFLSACQASSPSILGTYQSQDKTTLFVLKNGVIEQEIKATNTAQYEKGVYIIEKENNHLISYLKNKKEVYQIKKDQLINLNSNIIFQKK